ncbi:class I SAM-dependent methyltransferase [Candidatus Dependentiae bacterium]
MNRFYSFFILLCLLSAFKISSAPKKPYQDIIINNVVIEKGYGPDCESRYNAIKNALLDFKKPITVLDIGAAEGYMSFRIAHDLESQCLMIGDPHGCGKALPRLCKLNTSLNNISYLLKRMSAQDLEKLNKKRHFDVVIALNILHHFPQNKWKKAAKAILKLGDYVIIETPPAEDTKQTGRKFLPDIIKFIEEHDFEIIANTRRVHTDPNLFSNMYLIKNKDYSTN